MGGSCLLSLVKSASYSMLGAAGARAAVGSFCLAASNGDLTMLRLLEENGIDRNAMDYDQRTALHLACSDQQILSINHLLNVCQADPNICDRWKVRRRARRLLRWRRTCQLSSMSSI